MSFLDDLPGWLSDALSGELYASRLWRAVPGAPMQDAWGQDIPGPEQIVSFPLSGIIDRNRAALVSKGADAATIQERDVMGLFLLHGVPIVPAPEDEFAVSGPVGKGERFRIVALLEMDPARAHCVVQGRPIA